MIDLRSDTVTKPTEAMRAAMAAAEVGDDVYGEDPTVNRLQEVAAALLGKEAGLFFPSGSMANLTAVKCHTQPGEEVILDRYAHICQFEMGGMAWFSGLMPRTLEGHRGILEPDVVQSAIRRNVPYYVARTGLICVENTHNAGGGSVYPRATLAAIHQVAREAEVPVHLDGARLFHAVAAAGVPASRYAACADSVMISLSKGLSAPAGSVLCGGRDFIDSARRVRRVLGGGMRQAGVLAAPGLVALREMRERLAEDHAVARRLAEGLSALPGIEVDLEAVQTNIVICRPAGGAEPARRLVGLLRDEGVLVSQLSPETIRLVTHRHIGAAEAEMALGVFRRLVVG
jgi:threonine aldolase